MKTLRIPERFYNGGGFAVAGICSEKVLALVYIKRTLTEAPRLPGANDPDEKTAVEMVRKLISAEGADSSIVSGMIGNEPIFLYDFFGPGTSAHW